MVTSIFEAEYHSLIAHSDPLQMDGMIMDVRHANETGNIRALSEILQVSLSKFKKLKELDDASARAAMRDIGFVCSSIRRHGVQPNAINPNIEEVLCELGQLTRMVPRDTIFHYAVWNPSGKRERSFTFFKDETALIESVRVAIIGVEQAAYKIWLVINGKANQDCFDDITANMEAMVDGMAVAIRGVNPKIFSQDLRPYFDPIEVKGKSYIASGGGQVPLFLIDHILWYSGKSGGNYNHFISESAEYLPHYLKNIFLSVKDSHSLLGQLEGKRASGMRPDKGDEKTIDFLDQSMRIILKFRMPHFRYAEKSFSKENIGNYDTGSGGYKMDFVTTVLEETRLANNAIQNLKKWLRE